MIKIMYIGCWYWVLTDRSHSYEVGKKDFDNLKYCLFTKIIEDERRKIVSYWFQHSNDYNGFVIPQHDSDKTIFFNIDEYLQYMVKKVKKLNSGELFDFNYIYNTNEQYRFDAFFRNKILESQDERPELWI